MLLQPTKGKYSLSVIENFKCIIYSYVCILFFSEGDPSLYDDYFTGLKDFVEISLDIYKVATLF